MIVECTIIPTPLVKFVCESITQEPERWVRTFFRASNEHRGISVWLGSTGHAGTHVEIYGVEYGGVTGLSVFFGWLIPSRRRVRRAALSLEYQSSTLRTLGDLIAEARSIPPPLTEGL